MDAKEFSDDRTYGIALIRRWARTQALWHKNYAALDAQLADTIRAVVEEFRVEFDVPGVRYWHVPEGDLYFTTAAGERLPPIKGEVIELKRYEFLSRQGIHYGYEDRL